MRLFRHLPVFGRPAFRAPLAPEIPFAVIGDIHGCDRLLSELISRLERLELPPQHVVCVGDYIDRGDESAAVLRRLHRLTLEAGVTCLLGNHEDMLIDFLDRPERAGPRWLRYGGLQTLASFGLGPIAETAPEEAWRAHRDALRLAMGEDLEAWLRRLPLFWRSGNIAVVHAGADPAVRLSDQSRRSLLWGHPEFSRTARQDGLWVIHGHTVVERIAHRDGRIGIDTGAYATGRLSAALVSTWDVEVIST